MRLVESRQTQVSLRQEVEAISQTVQQTWEEWMLEQGELRGQQKMLRKLLEKRFGLLPQALAQRLETITDSTHLSNLGGQVLHIQALDELQI
jgi:hypothetical protein